MAGSEESRFFEHGVVRLGMVDDRSRQVSISIIAPFCVVQAATPVLLGHGFMDEFRVHDPLAVWMPPIKPDAFKDLVRVPHPDVAVQARVIVNQHVSRLLTTFHEISQAMDDPSELVPMLPIGTYVHVRYRSALDEYVKVLEKLQAEAVAGVLEVRYAMAEVLAYVLTPRPSDT